MSNVFKFLRSNEEITEPLLRPLFNDLVECDEMLERADTQFARRTYVRASFAFLEGQLFWFKDHVKQMLISVELNTDLDVGKIALLSDDTYRLNKQGKLESETSRIPFANMCAFVLLTAAQRSKL